MELMNCPTAANVNASPVRTVPKAMRNVIVLHPARKERSKTRRAHETLLSTHVLLTRGQAA